MDAIEEVIRQELDHSAEQSGEYDYEHLYDMTLLNDLGLSEDEARAYMTKVTGKTWDEIFATFRENTGKQASA